jgi:hypothetical protein
MLAFYHRSDAFCAKDLLNLFPIFDDGNFLQVRFKSTIGRSQRKTSVVAKSSGLAA